MQTQKQMQTLWVDVGSSYIGFSSERIAEFERELNGVRQFLPNVEYWDYFNWYFAELLSGKYAVGYRH